MGTMSCQNVSLDADIDVARGVGARGEDMCHKICCVYFMF